MKTSILVTCLLLTAACGVPVDSASGDAQRAVEGIQSFGQRLAEATELSTHTDCPWITYRALALLWAGARTETADEIAAVLGDPGGQQIWPDLEALNRLLQPEEDGRCPVSISERLWVQADFPIQPEFLQFARHQGIEEPESIDFRADAEQARDRINGWVCAETKDRIQELFPAHSITTEARLVLACTAFFRGQWQETFERKHTRRERFHGVSGTTRVPMMHRIGRMAYAEDEGWQGVELPFDDDQTVMAVVLPPPDLAGPQAIEQLPDVMKHLQTRSSSRQVDLSLPRFTIESSADLSPRLKTLGMPLAFSSKAADFSGISPDVYLFGIYHSVAVQVDEAGATAAAATGAVMAEKGMSPRREPLVIFQADRPFFFRIFDMETGLVYFSGTVADLPDSRL